MDIMFDKVIYFAFVLAIFQTLKVEGNMKGLKIKNGEDAAIEDYPHAAFLIIRCQKISTCGGSILTVDIIMTAAHCVASCLDPVSDSGVDVHVGSTKLEDAEYYKSQQIVIHEEYTTGKFSFDIGLIKIEPLQFSDKVKKVAIVENPSYKNAVVAGWGKTEKQEISTTLQKMDQKVRCAKVCTRLLGPLDEGVFCASHSSKPTSVETGDSGDALVTNGHVQVGIVAYKSMKFQTVAVYTNVSYYYDWITSTVASLNNCDM